MSQRNETDEKKQIFLIFSSDVIFYSLMGFCLLFHEHVVSDYHPNSSNLHSHLVR